MAITHPLPQSTRETPAGAQQTRTCDECETTKPLLPGQIDVHTLTFQQLRNYRDILNDTETVVSYWRRLIQTRIDILNALQHPQEEHRHINHDTQEAARDIPLPDLTPFLVSLLQENASPRPNRKTSLPPTSHINYTNPLAEKMLPANLPSLWNALPPTLDPVNPVKYQQHLAQLRSAEQTLTNLRHAIHQHISHVTETLVGFYKTDLHLVDAILAKRH